MTTTETLTLADLYIHPLNPRSVHLDEEVEAKARSILSVGLIHNLAGYRDPEREGVGIVAGGYRLLALQMIASGSLGPHDLPPIRVEVAEDHVKAEAWAVAENVAQVPLTPAEEISAYGKMARDTGVTPDLIAKAFAVTERHVRQRLSLADLPTPILKGLAERKITLDTAKLFTTAASPEAAVEIYETATREGWNEWSIKQRLKGDRIGMDDRRVRFVGLARLELEGVAVQRSLFSDDAFVQIDPAQLDDLFKHDLETARVEAEGEGWAFVWASEEDSAWSIRNGDPRLKGFEEIDPEPVELPEADLARLEELSETPDYQLTKAEVQELDDMIARERGSYTDEQLTTIGCMIFVDRQGQLQRIEGLRKRETNSNDETSPAASKPAPPAVPDAVRDDMAAIALHARQRALLGKTELLLDLFAYQLETDIPEWHRIFALATNPPKTTPGVAAGFSPSERLAWPTREYNSPEPSGEAFAAFQAKGQKYRNQILSLRLPALLNHMATDLKVNLNTATAPDVRAIWTPGFENFFSRLRGPALDQIEAELLHDADEDKRAAFAKMKVKEKARELSDLFENAEVREAWGLSREQATRLDRWIPEDMRRHLVVHEAAAEEEAA
ncbi:MAG: ParB/RepB/Spo0J family partition protein [Pseudomonadota bacterium]|nr:ParB/RepB/Spo0J family partition protein [Pseudomonadota bacterium]